MKEQNLLFEPLSPEEIQIPMEFTERRTYWENVAKKLKENKMALLALSIFTFLLSMAMIAPYFNTFTHFDINLDIKNLPPSELFWFGTDELGRDVFTRVWMGTRISFLVGFAAAIIDLFIGVIWGTTAALFGGKTDELMMRICDIIYSIPYLLTVILLMVVLGSGLWTILIALTLTGWINMARIVRAQILQLKESEYINAAKAIGASRFRIIFRHLIPNAMGPILATMTLTIPSAIFTEAFLSFLGLGIQAPIASLGVMINDGLGALSYFPWRLFFPALVLTFAIFALNLFGDSLRDILDPRLQNEFDS